MSAAELDVLEREVEQARARFAADLAALGSPRRVGDLKEDLWTQATRTKDDLVETTKDAARNATQRVIDDLKDRAVANPAAALAIGAGLTWRIFQRPPIASLLVGIGLVSLLRTSPSQRKHPDMGRFDAGLSADGLLTRASLAVETAKTRAGEWTQQAGETARETASQIGNTASHIGEEATSAAERASAAARETAAHVKEGVAHVKEGVASAANEAARMTGEAVRGLSDKASAAVHEAVTDPKTRDAYLFGVAALAVAAAVGIAYQRRMEQQQPL